MTKSEEILQLTTKIKILEDKLTIKDKLIFLLDESIPKEQSSRKKYMSDIAFFYATIFKEKLKHFIGDQLNELARIGRTEVGDDIIRANISCFRLIDEWMLLRHNEHVGNIEDIRNRVQDDKELINEMNKIYGEDKTKKN